MNRVSYFFNQEKQKLTLVYRIDEWSDRNLSAKGFTSARRIFTREMTIDESYGVSDATRLHFISYQRWDDLIEDERAVGVPNDFVEKIVLFSKTHPLKN